MCWFWLAPFGSPWTRPSAPAILAWVRLCSLIITSPHWYSGIAPDIFSCFLRNRLPHRTRKDLEPFLRDCLKRSALPWSLALRSPWFVRCLLSSHGGTSAQFARRTAPHSANSHRNSTQTCRLASP